MSPFSCQRTAGILLRHFYLLRSSPSRLLPLFIWVVIDILLWGFITRYLNTITTSGIDLVPALLGAVLLWDFFSRVMHGVTIAFFEDVWSRNFLNVFASPLSLAEYLAGLVLSAMLTSGMALLVMLVMATLLFGFSAFVFGAAFIPFLLVLFLVGIAFGIVGCAIVLRLGPSAEWFVWPIPGLLAAFVGVFYPIATLPAWMQGVAWALPPSYVFEGMRALVSGGAIQSDTLAAGAILACLYLVLAGVIFARVYAHAVRTGLIARYSAETIN